MKILFTIPLFLFIACSSAPTGPIQVVYDEPVGCRSLEWVRANSSEELSSGEFKRELVDAASRVDGATHLYIDNVSARQASGHAFACPTKN